MGDATLFTKITYLRNAVLYVEAKGKLDIYNAQDYLDEIKPNFKYIKELILDFSQIKYVSSIGLRVILELQKIADDQECEMILKNVKEEVLDVFRITGFDKFLTIKNDAENVN